MDIRMRSKVVAGTAALALLFAACGDAEADTENVGAEETAGDTTADYCELAAELDEQDGFPSADQLEALQEAAPEEIRDEVDAVVPVLIEGIEAGDGEAAFEDPVVTDNFPAIEDFEDENCTTDDEGEDEDAADFVIAPEDEEFCAIAVELDEQEDFPSVEQLETYRAAAPEEIVEEASVVVEAFAAAGDDPFAAFEDPAVNAAFDVIEPFEAEHCGLHVDDDEEAEQDPSVTEPDAAAAQVAVTATDYAFGLDTDPSSGRTQFTMSNAGEERHVMYLFRLSDGVTADEVLASEGQEGYEEDFESDTAAAGEEAVLTADLSAGDWVMICYLPTADGTSHFELGMRTEFTVS